MDSSRLHTIVLMAVLGAILVLEDEDLEGIQLLQLMAEQSFLRDDEAVDDDSEDDAVNQDEDGIADAILAFAALALESTREVS